MSLLDSKPIYKPFNYPWAYDAWLMQQRIHWLPEEVPLADDVKDWRNKLSESERHLLMHIFRFFTQSDVEVNNCYMKHYSRVFKPTEVQMMLSAFSSMETVHIAAYSHLLDTLGIPEAEYSAFLRYKDMKDKYDYMQGFNVDSKADIAKTLAVFGAFTEGLQLFASFAMLLNFPRFNKMKGMGQIVSWSVRDETLHTNSIIKLFRTFCEEHPEVMDDAFRAELIEICHEIVDLCRLLDHRRPRGRLHRPGIRDGRHRGHDARRRQAIHPLHRRPPAGPARPAGDLPHREEPAAVARQHAERGRAHQFLRKPRHRVFKSRYSRHLGGGLRVTRPTGRSASLFLPPLGLLPTLTAPRFVAGRFVFSRRISALPCTPFMSPFA